jgi:hypothetical protein
MYDSAERQDLSPVPLITASEKRTLQAHGVTSLRALAKLFTLPAAGSRLSPAPEHEALVQTLAGTWPLAARLEQALKAAESEIQHVRRQMQAL